MTTLKIDSLPAAKVDIGEAGHPGSQATQIICAISARRDGRWEARGTWSRGSNQVYYQPDYTYGPWTGRGATPAEAVAHMLDRVPDGYREDIRRAGHDALLRCDGLTFAALARYEAERIQDVIDRGESAGCHCARVGSQLLYVCADERMAIRRKAVAMLRTIADAASRTVDA